MSIHLLGYAMMLVMFVGFFCLIWFEDGLRDAITVFGITALVFAWVVVAVYLMSFKEALT